MLFVYAFLCRVAAAGRWCTDVNWVRYYVPVLGHVVLLVGWLLRGFAFAVGSVFFVRLPRLALPWLPWRVARCCAWVCVPPSVLAVSSPACFVAPALVVRFGRCRGLVLRVWVFASVFWGPEDYDPKTKVVTPCGGCGGFAAAPAAASNTN